MDQAQKLGIIQKVFSHPDLYAQIIALNPHLRQVMDLFERKFSELKSIVEKGRVEDLRKRIQQGASGAWTGGSHFAAVAERAER